jgi:hypothetical protein
MCSQKLFVMLHQRLKCNVKT